MQIPKRLRWVGLGVFLAWSCTGIRRTPATRVGGDFTIGEGQNFLTSVTREMYQQKTVSAHVRRESAGGGILLARVRGALGSSISETTYSDVPVDLDPPADYAILGVGLAAGSDYRSFGCTVGITGLVGQSDLFVWPYAQFRFGVIDEGWGTFTLGSNDPLYHARLIGLGMGLRGKRYRVNFSGVISTMFVDQIGRLREINPFPGAEIELQLLPFDDSSFAFELGGVVASEFFGQLGMSIGF